MSEVSSKGKVAVENLEIGQNENISEIMQQLGDLNILTVDFTKEISEFIKDGSIKSSIAQRAFSWGSMSLTFLVDIFDGKSVVKYADTGTYEVNAKNMAIYEKRI